MSSAKIHNCVWRMKRISFSHCTWNKISGDFNWRYKDFFFVMSKTVNLKTKQQNKKNEELKWMHEYSFLCRQDHKNRWSVVVMCLCARFASENDNQCGWDFFIIHSWLWNCGYVRKIRTETVRETDRQREWASVQFNEIVVVGKFRSQWSVKSK